MGCENLESVIIPYNVKTIGPSAFEGCGNLKMIKYEGLVDQWEKIQKDELWNESCPADMKIVYRRKMSEIVMGKKSVSSLVKQFLETPQKL